MQKHYLSSSFASTGRAAGYLELATVGNDDGLAGGSAVGSDALDLLDDVHTLDNLAEDDVLAVQPSGLHGAQEELGSVG